MRNPTPLVLLTLCLGACTVGQLKTFKSDESAQKFDKIAQTPIKDCDGSSSEECAQLAEIQAHACLTLATRQAAPGAMCPPSTARQLLSCATNGFAAAQLGNHFSGDPLINITENRAHALYCEATLIARSDGISKAREAVREIATLPDSPSRALLAANAALYVGNTEDLSATERCDGARQSAQLAQRGIANGAAGDVLTGLNNTQRLALGVIQRLPSCRAP